MILLLRHIKRWFPTPKFCIVSLLCLSFVLPSLAQKMTLSQQVIPDEVAKMRCLDILEDQYGFIWLGGTGLKKYNGYDTKSYSANKDTFPNGMGRVYALLEDKNGQIWIGTTLGLFRYFRESDKIVPWFYKKLINKRGKESKIASLYEDSKGQIWMGGDDNLFVITDAKREEFQTIEGLDLEMSHQFKTGVHCIRENREGRIFAGTTNGVWEVLPDFSIAQYLPPEFESEINNFRVFDMELGKEDTLWLAGVEGLWAFETSSKKLSKIEIPEYPIESTREIFIDEKEQLWVSDTYRLYVRSNGGKFKQYPIYPNRTIVGISSMVKDRFGNIWLGAAFTVLKLEHEQNEMLPLYRLVGDSFSDDNFFFRIMRDSNDGLWFRMMKSGLGYCAELEEGTFETLLRPPNTSYSSEIKNFCTDMDGNVWTITLTQGLFHFPKGQKKYKYIELGDSIKASNPNVIIADEVNGQWLWVASKFGLCRINRFTFEQKWYEPSKDIPGLLRNGIGGMSQDEKGNIWHAVNRKEGSKILCYFNPWKEKFYAISEPQYGKEFLSMRHNKKVKPNTLWINTNGAVFIVDAKKKTYKFINKKNGLPTNSALSLTPDLEGNVWYSTGLKICKYDWKEFECFNANPNIGGFTYASSTLLKDGRLMFGGSKGLHVFDPKKLKRDTVVPKIYLTDFQVFDKRKKLGQAYELVDNITLPYSENSINFEFASLHFVQTKLIKYEYKLEGFNKEWIKTNGDKRNILYSNLQPGDYVFRVKAINSDGLETTEEKSLKIELTILPPWYRRNLAWFIWISSFIGLLLAFYYFQLYRRLAEAEANRLKELDLAKSELYTNITHEFRTPLTIILGMAEQVKNDPKNWFNEGLVLIQRNGKQLLNLVNQMLDLSKLESGNMQLKLINGDIVSFLHYLIESFHSYADSKDIRLHFSSDFKEFSMDYDPEKIQNVISNLLSNGIKFTPTGGDIYLDIRAIPNEEKSILLQIRDNGIGITKVHLPFIFDRFYQADSTTTRRGEGTGIGLALTKELIKLMGGEIKVESEINQGTKFSIILPVTQDAKETDGQKLERTPPQVGATVLIKNEITAVDLETAHLKNPLVLLIEDNQDVITYLSSFLSGEYQIETALNGQLGIDKAIELIPDLIVSDVMMPEKDGFEVCAILKKDERTSHIPIMLLTAKSDLSAKIEGLTHGADAYLAKPFNKEELLVRIEKLIELRRQMSQHFQNNNLLEVVEKQQPTSEEIFLQKLIQIVEENLSDEHFGLPELCKKAGLSRSQLFRKLKALTGKSTTKFIRSIRLEKGKKLLEDTDLTISEIAFQIGFGSPNYFARTFQNAFGVSPSSFRNR